jgi:small conductance mechanosensitive channel
MDKWIDLIRLKLHSWMLGFIKLLPNMILAIIVFAVFFILAKYIRRLINRMLIRLSVKPALSSLLSNIFYLIFIFVGFFVSLELLHLEKTISSLLAGAGIIGLALGFAFQDLTANFISGIFIIFRKPFDIGNLIETNGLTGTVEEIQLRSTTIRTIQGLHIILPNKDIFQKPITNYSLSGDRRIDITMVFPANTNLDLLEQKLHKAFADTNELNGGHSVDFYYTDFTGDKITVEVHCSINNSVPKGFVNAKNEIIKRLQKELNPS